MLTVDCTKAPVAQLALGVLMTEKKATPAQSRWPNATVARSLRTSPATARQILGGNGHPTGEYPIMRHMMKY